MSISRTAIAEGAVRRPLLSRFTPKAAQRRLESVCGASFSSPILRFVCLSFNACIRGLPPCLWGFGSTIGCNPCAGVGAGLENSARIGANAADLCKNVLRFMACAPGIRIMQSGVRKRETAAGAARGAGSYNDFVRRLESKNEDTPQCETTRFDGLGRRFARSLGRPGAEPGRPARAGFPESAQ